MNDLFNVTQSSFIDEDDRHVGAQFASSDTSLLGGNAWI
jgi:hypothetical protein